MGTFTFNGYKFESRQTESQNIVWLAGKPDDAEKMPRSFNFGEVAEHFLINRDMPEQARIEKHIIIENDRIVILRDGYNIIETTIHGEDIPQVLIEALEYARDALDMDNMNAVGILSNLIKQLKQEQ